MSGKKDSTTSISNFLEENYKDLDYIIYNTQGINDATNYVKTFCNENQNQDDITFYACGGDGTLNEVINGAVGFKNVYVSVYPCGSGNDFVKTFGKENYFKDLHNIINGKSKKIDLLKVNGRYTINMANLGFDASVAYNMQKFKKWPLITGKGAYNISLIYSLIFNMKHQCKIIIDEKEVFNGKMLLTAAGNGVCCGGGYYCLPNAKVDDGFIEAVFIKKISRIKFLAMVGKYKDGTYINDEKYKKYLTLKKCKNIKLIANKEIAYCLDGECSCNTKFDISIEPQIINFIIPKQYGLNN